MALWRVRVQIATYEHRTVDVEADTVSSATRRAKALQDEPPATVSVVNAMMVDSAGDSGRLLCPCGKPLSRDGRCADSW